MLEASIGETFMKEKVETGPGTGWDSLRTYCAIFSVEIGLAAALGVIVVSTAKARTRDLETAPILPATSSFQLVPDTPMITWLILLSWMGTSFVMIVLNKYIQVPDGGDFPFAITLTAIHQLLVTIMTQFLAHTPFGKQNMPAVSQNGFLAGLSHHEVSLMILPAALYAVSLAFGNRAVLDLSLSFSQMLNAGKPMIVLLFSLVLGLEKEASWVTFILVVLACFGIFCVSFGEAEFSQIGFTFMTLAILADSGRIVSLKMLVSLPKLDPFSALLVFAPTCFLLLAGPMVYLELPYITMERLWHAKYYLLLSGFVAVALNMISILAVSVASPVLLSLCGATNYLFVVAFSRIVFHSALSRIQIFGFFVAVMSTQIFFRYQAQKKREGASA
jgi:drug/metabolite transporter (DMT)-like permease